MKLLASIRWKVRTETLNVQSLQPQLHRAVLSLNGIGHIVPCTVASEGVNNEDRNWMDGTPSDAVEAARMSPWGLTRILLHSVDNRCPLSRRAFVVRDNVTAGCRRDVFKSAAYSSGVRRRLHGSSLRFTLIASRWPFARFVRDGNEQRRAHHEPPFELRASSKFANLRFPVRGISVKRQRARRASELSLNVSRSVRETHRTIRAGTRRWRNFSITVRSTETRPAGATPHICALREFFIRKLPREQRISLAHALGPALTAFYRNS